MATASERLWRTSDNRLVRDGDEAGTSLAYTPGDEIKPADESRVPGDKPAEEPAEQPAEEKSVAKPADKAAGRAANK